MRTSAKTALIFIVLVVVIAVLVPLLVPAERFKGPAIKEIETLTGRTVTIDTISLSMFPNIALKAHRVTLGNAVWAGDKPMADIENMRLGVELLPLLKGELRLQELALENPQINLIKQGDKANWQFAAPPPVTAEAQPIKPSKTTVKKPNNANPFATFAGHIIIKNGTISYNDNGHAQSLDNVDIDIDTSIGGTFIVTASTVYNNTKTSLKLSIADIAKAFKGESSDGTFAFDYGSLTAQWKGPIALKAQPEITGAITVGTIDMASLHAPDNTPPANTKPAAAPAANAVRWSNTPIDTSFLGKANGNLSLHIDALTFPKTTLSNINTTILLNNGTLNTAVKNLQAYGGTLSLTLSISNAHTIAFSADAEGVKAQELLHDFAELDTVDGTLSEHITGSATGTSEHAWVNSLQGKGDFQIKNGSTKGKDLLAMAQNITSAFGETGRQDTVFSSLSGSFTIANGTVSNSDLKMQSQLGTVGGSGTVDLPDWTLNYLLKPVIASAVAVPIRIEGPLNHPSYRPDLQAALYENLAHPPLGKGAVKELKKNLLGNNSLQNLLR